jgi:hypothetical protein
MSKMSERTVYLARSLSFEGVESDTLAALFCASKTLAIACLRNIAIAFYPNLLEIFIMTHTTHTQQAIFASFVVDEQTLAQAQLELPQFLIRHLGCFRQVV